MRGYVDEVRAATTTADAALAALRSESADHGSRLGQLSKTTTEQGAAITALKGEVCALLAGCIFSNLV